MSALPRTIVPPLLPPREAIELIQDGDTLAASGFGMMGVAHTLHRVLLERFQETGHPGNLTYIHAAGHYLEGGLELLAPHGIVSRVIGGHWGVMPELRRIIGEEKIEAHNWPQGVVIGALRAAASGERDGLRSPIGLGTFVDPRQTGGCANQTARDCGSKIHLVEQNGRELLQYDPLKPDIALIRGWSADRLGNVALGMEPLNLSIDVIAMAARHNGGKVICQVRHIDHDTVYPSHQVAVPGFMIDALVLAENPSQEHRQSYSYDADPALVNDGIGEQPQCPLPRVPEGPRGWIGRRAAMEIAPGDVLNLGIGIPGDAVGAALSEAGRLGEVVPTIESGLFGGVALGDLNFGVALYPNARIDQVAMFDMYHGGGLDIAVMGAAQLDARGNINVSQFNNRAVGCGGFVDITQSARKVVFCTTFTSSGLEAAFEDGALRIVQEGRHRKFIPEVEQITFNSQRALENQQPVLVVTERCVFRLVPEGWELIEIAPGIELERDILPLMDFTPRISSDLKTMPECCFTGRHSA